MRRYVGANGTDPVPDQVKKACIISNTPEPLKTHLYLNTGKLGNFNEFRVATEDYLRSRRIFKTTSAGNTRRRFNGSRCCLPKRDRKREIRQGQEGWQEKKRKPLRKRLRRNDNRTLTIRRRMPKLWKVWTQSNLIVGRSRRTNLKVNSKEVDDWNPSSNTSTQQQKFISSEHDWMRR